MLIYLKLEDCSIWLNKHLQLHRVIFLHCCYYLEIKPPIFFTKYQKKLDGKTVLWQPTEIMISGPWGQDSFSSKQLTKLGQNLCFKADVSLYKSHLNDSDNQLRGAQKQMYQRIMLKVFIFCIYWKDLSNNAVFVKQANY